MDVERPRCLRKPLVVPDKLLMGPGPSNCPPRVLHAMARPVLGHLHKETTDYMDEIKEGIRYMFQTKNVLTLAVSGSGHAGMEALMCNLLEPGDRVLIAVNGIWGERASMMAMRYGAIVSRLEANIGDNFTLEDIEKGLAEHRPKLFFIVQGDSSTGVYQPLDGVGDLCHKYNCMCGVDTVASLGGVPLFSDRWGLDAIYTGSQKVLGGPAGITPISFSRRAQDAIFRRKTPVKVFYFDMTILCDYWKCFDNPRLYHHTISSTLVMGLRESLAIVAEEGLENSITRHKQCAERLYRGIRQLGLQLLVEDINKRLPTVTTVMVPKGVDWKKVVSYCMDNYSLEISGGLGPTADKVWRIGLMGFNATFANVDFVLKVMKEALVHVGYVNKL